MHDVTTAEPQKINLLQFLFVFGVLCEIHIAQKKNSNTWHADKTNKIKKKKTKK